MRPLAQALQALKRPAKSWHLIISPDPIKSYGHRLSSEDDVGVFYLKFEQDMNHEGYRCDNPTLRSAANVSYGVFVNLKTPLQPETPNPWSKLRYASQKDTSGQSFRDVLVHLLDEFPRYDLSSVKGAEKAIGDIERKITAVASVESASVQE